MIRIENLSMVFTTEDVQTRALNDVSLEIQKGEFVAVMGPPESWKILCVRHLQQKGKAVL